MDRQKVAGCANGGADMTQAMNIASVAGMRLVGGSEPPSISLRGIRVHAISEQQCVQHVLDAMAQQRGGWIITANLDHLRRGEMDEDYRNLLAEADLVVADGMPVIWAAKIQGSPLPERVAGSDLISSLAEGLATSKRTAFFLGGDEGTAESAAAALTERFDGFCCAGTYSPPFGFEKDADEMTKLTHEIAHACPDLVYVALGSPKQECLIHVLREDFPNIWWIGVGISFSFLSGDVKRAPGWAQSTGLEWLHRLSQEPRRLARRYLLQGIPYAARLMLGSLRNRNNKTTA